MNELFVGASKGFAKSLQNRRAEEGHRIFNVSGWIATDTDSLQVDWAKINETNLHRWLRQLPKIDLIFFNQNSSSLSESSFRDNTYQDLDLWKQIAHWKQSYFVSCQLPFQIVHSLGDRLHKDSRVCWMLSSMVVRDKSHTGYADYIGNKFQNYIIMKNFAKTHGSCFFGIEPGGINNHHDLEKITVLQHILQRPVDIVNGKVFDSAGSESALFNLFDH